MNTSPTEQPPAAKVPRRLADSALTTAPAQRVTAGEVSPRILYVDDDVIIRKLGEQLLLRSGYQVDTASDGVEAWAALQTQAYDLLITDNQMPHLSGLELIRKVRLARMTVPIILASGTVGALPVEDRLKLECSAMLAKPFTGGQLLAVVREVLRAAVSVPDALAIRLPVGETLNLLAQPHIRWGINE